MNKQLPSVFLDLPSTQQGAILNFSNITVNFCMGLDPALHFAAFRAYNPQFKRAYDPLFKKSAAAMVTLWT